MKWSGVTLDKLPVKYVLKATAMAMAAISQKKIAEFNEKIVKFVKV